MTTTPGVDLGASVEDFLASLVINGASAHTVRAYRADLAGWLAHLGPKANAPLPVREMEVAAAEYLNANRGTWAPKTTERKLGTLRSFARHAGVTGFLAGYRAPHPARPEPHPLPEGIPGVLAMLSACTTPTGLVTPRIRRRRALVALTGLCGLRVGEALSLKATNIDQHDRTLTVRGKGDRTRVVPISDLAWPTVLDAMSVTPLGETIVGMHDRGARQLLTNLAVRAGLSRPVSSHDMRATLATAAYQRSKDLRVVQTILGHASPDQTQVYTGVTQAAVRDALNVA